MRHFAGIYNGGIDGGGQQILGSPTIRVSGGNGGSGGQGADRFTFTSNLAFIGSESGAREIAADSIELIAGTANFAVADLTNWGGDLPGSATGAQSISVLHGLTLRGGTRRIQAYARLYSHSGPQTIDVDGTLVLQRTGAGDVFLGNVFDASVASIGAATVTVNATGGIQLQGGNLWADESLILSLGSSSSVTGGAMHVGRTSAPTTGGDIVVDPTGSLHLSGSLTLSGSVTNQGLLAYSAGTLTVANGATNEGILQLTTTAANTPASVYVFGGQFVNAVGGTVQSLTAGGASANTLQGNVINQGLIDATHFLTVNNGGTVFDTTSGTLQAGTDSILTINAGTVRMGTGTGFGAGSGIIDLGGSLALELASDLTIPASGAHLRLSGSVGIAPGPGVSAVSLINAGALDLSNGSLDGAVTLVNQGDLTLRDTNGAGALSNLADGTVHVYGNANSMGQVSNSGLIELIAAADSGAQLSIYSTDLAFTNEASGVIHSLSAGAPATNYNSLYVYQSSGSAGGGVVNSGRHCRRPPVAGRQQQQCGVRYQRRHSRDRRRADPDGYQRQPAHRRYDELRNQRRNIGPGIGRARAGERCDGAVERGSAAWAERIDRHRACPRGQCGDSDQRGGAGSEQRFAEWRGDAGQPRDAGGGQHQCGGDPEQRGERYRAGA